MLVIPSPDYVIPWSAPNGTDMDDVAGVSFLGGDSDGEVQNGFAVPANAAGAIWQFTGALTDANVGYEGSFRFPAGFDALLAFPFLSDISSEAGLASSCPWRPRGSRATRT